MLGWSIRARACRSASNRATTSLRVHPRLDDLQGDFAADGFSLLGHVDHAHAAFADLLQELIAADHRAGALGHGGHVKGGGDAAWRRFEEARLFVVHPQEHGDAVEECGIVAANLAQVVVANFRRFNATGHFEDGLFVEQLGAHGIPSENLQDGSLPINARMRPKLCDEKWENFSETWSLSQNR